MRTARPHTATRQLARPRWPHSPRAGGGSGRDENARVEAVIPNNSLAESNKSDSPVLINSPASGATERALPTELGAPAVIRGSVGKRTVSDLPGVHERRRLRRGLR